MKFDFNFGKKKPTIIKYAIVGFILSSIIAGLSQCTHIKEDTLWDLLDETQRRYFPDTIINDFFIKDPEKLQRRVERDVDKAIENATPEYDRIIEKYDRRYKPVYIEEPINKETCYTVQCRALGPPIRICAPWYDQCPRGLTDSPSGGTL